MSEPSTFEPKSTRGPGKPKPRLVVYDSGWKVKGFTEYCGRKYRVEQRTINYGTSYSTDIRHVPIGRL